MPKRKLVLERVTRKRDIAPYAVYLAYDTKGATSSLVYGGDIMRHCLRSYYRGWMFYGPITGKVK